MLFLSINALMYIYAFVIAVKKTHGLNVYTFLVGWFMAIAVIGVISFADGTYQDTFQDFNIEVIDLFYFILAFFVYLYLFRPIKKLATTKIDNSRIPHSRAFKYFLFLHYTLLFVLICYLIPLLGRTISNGIQETYIEKMSGPRDYPKYIFLSKRYFTGAYYFLYVCTGYLLTLKPYTKIALFAFFELFAFQTLLNLIEVSRGGVLFAITDFIFVYLIFRKDINKKTRKILTRSLSISLIVIIFATAAITLSRFGADGARVAFKEVERYFGESFPNYGYRVMGEAKAHLYGERFAPFIYEYIYGKEVYKAEGMFDYQNYYEQKTNIPILNFKTLVGDFYTEFGLLWGIFWLIIIGHFFSFAIKGRKCHLYSVIILFYYYQFCFIGANDNIKTLSDPQMLCMNAFWVVLMYYLESVVRFNDVKLQMKN